MIKSMEQFQGLNITFNTGEACNLACKYCYEVGKKQTVLSLDYAKKFIDLLLTTEDPIGAKGTDFDWIYDNGLILDFIGGDALMHPDLVEDILEYFIVQAHKLNHKWKDNWRGSISTNGTLFSKPEVKRFIEKWYENVSIGVSIDGCPELHDLNRIYVDGSGTLKDIEKDWEWFSSYYPIRSTKSTLSKASIPYIYKSLVYMHEVLKITQINQNFIFEDMHLEQTDLDELDRQMEISVEYVLKHKDDLYWSMIDDRFNHSLCYADNIKQNPNKSWCGSGAMPALSPDGKIYPCFRFLPHTQEKKVDMSVGDIWNGFSRKENFCHIRSQTREIISEDKCKKCDIESSCSWCIAGSYSETGKAGRQSYICEATKIQAKWSKIYWSKIKE